MKNIYDQKEQSISEEVKVDDTSWTESGLIVCPTAVIPGSYFTCTLQIDYDDNFAKIGKVRSKFNYTPLDEHQLVLCFFLSQ